MAEQVEVAVRFNLGFKVAYGALIAAGKPAKAARRRHAQARRPRQWVPGLGKTAALALLIDPFNLGPSAFQDDPAGDLAAAEVDDRGRLACAVSLVRGVEGRFAAPHHSYSSTSRKRRALNRAMVAIGANSWKSAACLS